MSDSRADTILRRQERLASARGLWESHWQEIAERILPRQAEFLGRRQAGEKRTREIVDSTAPRALERFAAVMDSLLTPRGRHWHGLRPADPALAEVREVRDYLERATEALFQVRYSPRASFAAQQHEIYMSLGAFGTAGLLVERAHDGAGIAYRSLHLGELFLEENPEGRVETLHRRFELEARHAVELWGERLPDSIRRAAESEPERRFAFVQAIEPRAHVDSGRLGAEAMAYVSTTVSLESRGVVAEGGYRTWPIMISRYVTAPREVYGRSPAMTVLPDIKMVNEMERTNLRVAHKLVDPPLLLADDGILGAIATRPGALNYGGIDEQGRQRVQPLRFGGELQFGLEMIEQKRRAINDAFLVSLFQMLVEAPRMSATEVLERAQEKGTLLAPVIGRLQSEALGPLIERELDLLERLGMLPPMPEALAEAGGTYDIVYESPLNRAERARQALGVLRAAELLEPFARLDPGILDNFDGDRVARLAAEAHGIERTLRSAEDVAALRRQRSEPSEATAGGEA